MNGPGTLVTVLIVLFMLFLAAMLAELCYILWCRRRFRRQTVTAEDPEFHGDRLSYAATTPSKEHLCFSCLKTQSRVEPGGAPESTPPSPEVADVLKWHMYGPSRVLYTIKEEEREGMESEKCSSAEKEPKTKTVLLEECFEVARSLAEATATVGVSETTPFSTPCSSPPYYTPPPSPSREPENAVWIQLDSPKNDQGSSCIDISGIINGV
ncbi:uncharacterized protein LOC131152281 [Malania oleifera]|uniref:uncharacterized protein LOC131152281 n=1 Tax=Malania oleifera TaxID=397392 RepID=UPI0025AE42DD|nr:uncharacterized protein LOC131152281 [Malania oleifera]